MATTAWYVRSTGSNLSSGGHDSDTARVTRDSATPGTVAAAVLTDAGATYVTSGVLVTDAVNLQIAGASVICEILSVDSETQITLTTSPGDGSYNYRIGGARAAINKVVNNGAGNNARITNNDTVGVKGGTYTENVVTPSVALFIYSSDGVEVVIDGTGGGAGSDCLVSTVPTTIRQVACINAVDDGIAATSTTFPTMVRCQSNGGDGLHTTGTTLYGQFNKFLSNGALGLNCGTGAFIIMLQSFIDGNTGNGFLLGGQLEVVSGCVITDNGGDGMSIPATSSNFTLLVNNTFEGNTGDGLELTATTSFGMGSRVLNNLFTNNAGYGVNSSAGAQTNSYMTDYNDFFGNGTPRNNFNTGTNDTAVNPLYTNAASDDYTPKATGGAYRLGYTAWGTNNKLQIGAVPGPGSAEQSGDYPAASDVRSGISYANGTLTGTMTTGGGLSLGFGF